MKKRLTFVLSLAVSAQAQFLQPEQDFARYLRLTPVTGQKGVYQNDAYKVYPKTQKGQVTGATLVFKHAVQLSKLDLPFRIMFPDLYFEDGFSEKIKPHLPEVRSPEGFTFTDDSGSYQIHFQGKDSKSYVLKINLIQRSLQDFPENAVVYGDPDAKVSVQIFSDFQCPACKILSQEVLADWKAKLPAQGVNIKYYHYPLSYHKNAVPTALASECARDQGKFWEYADYLFETTGWIRKSGTELQDALVSLASRLDLDTETFKTCYTSGQHQALIDGHMQAGKNVQVWGTPSVYVNGVPFPEWDNIWKLQTLIKLSK